MEQLDGRARVIITGVEPKVECGRFPARAVVDGKVEVEADIFTDGHDTATRFLERNTEQ